MEQGHHGHRHRTTDGAVQGFHGDRGWTEGAREEPDEVWVFCRYTGNYAGLQVNTVEAEINVFIVDLISLFSLAV